MNATTSFSRVLTLSLISTFVAVVGTAPAHSQSAPAPVSVGSHPGVRHETPLPTKPRAPRTDGAMRSMRPSEMPGQTTPPNERMRALEERLRSGQMDRPIAQDQVSDRLEQLHSGSAERSTGDTSSRQSVQGDMPY
ncbi:MAG TPA: hypothetical protein VLA67_06905 [Nitrospiraceae bacterium]|nr:hypothetical protein [Nitrospiraceae bacterium]